MAQWLDGPRRPDNPTARLPDCPSCLPVVVVVVVVVVEAVVGFVLGVVDGVVTLEVDGSNAFVVAFLITFND